MNVMLPSRGHPPVPYYLGNVSVERHVKLLIEQFQHRVEPAFLARRAELQQIGEDVAEDRIPVAIRTHLRSKAVRRIALVLAGEGHIAVSDQLRHFLQRVAGGKAGVVPTFPLTAIDASPP